MNTGWSKPTKYLVGIGLVILAIYVLRLSRPIIPLLIIAALIAVIVRPAIRLLHLRAHLPRGLAVGLVYLVVIILVPLAFMLAVPAIVDAVHYVVSLDYQGILQGSLEWLRSTLTSVRTTQLPLAPLDTYIDQMIDGILVQLEQAPPNAGAGAPSVATLLRSLGTALSFTFGAAADIVGAVFSYTALMIFMILASIYMSLSAHTYRQAFLNAVPAAYQPEIDILMSRIGRMWNAFFRGELTLMLVIGVLTWLGLTVLGVPGAVYLGIVAGLLELIPNIGPVISAVPAVIVALLEGSNYLPVSHLFFALLVVLLYILVQQLENNLVVPRVLGGAVELPPLVVMTGVLVGASAAGILGALLATPVIGTAREILRYIYRKMIGENPFPPEEPEALVPKRQPSRLSQLWHKRLQRRSSLRGQAIDPGEQERTSPTAE